MSVRVMIADDEALARARLRRLVALEAGTDVVAEAATVPDAARLVAETRPDILLLDIRMPGGDGFDVLDALAEPPPAVVFVTAYESHALRAFDVAAVDYLLKPFDAARFRLAFGRARARLRRRAEVPTAGDLRALLARLTSGTPPAGDRLLARTGQRIAFVPVSDVDWIEGAGNYVRLHVGDETHLVRASLTELEQRLGGRGFVRVHRSTIVNLDRVREMRHWSGGTHILELDDGTEVRVSPGYRDALLERFD